MGIRLSQFFNIIIFTWLQLRKGQVVGELELSVGSLAKESSVQKLWNETHEALFKNGMLVEVHEFATMRESKFNLKRTHSPPRIISQTNNHVVLAGRTADLICEVRGTLVNMVIKWIADELDALELEVVRSSPSVQLLRIPKASAIHTGNYTCVATNPYGEARLTFGVKVVETKDMNFAIYVYFVGSVLSALLLVLTVSFCGGRYCCTKKFILNFSQKVKGHRPENRDEPVCITKL